MTSPITPALKSSARSAYRALFRASGTTFAGDDRVRYAFRDKVRTETISGQQEADPAEYEARVKHAFEVADVLRKNVVQAIKQGDEEDATWKLRMTPDIELGSNESVKDPYSRPSRGQPRLKCGEDPNAVSPLPPRSLRHMTESNPTRSYSTATTPSSSPPNPDPSSSKQNNEYDRIRVQSLLNRLHEVNRRVSASPTGRERMTERTLVEDKLSALAARMEFLASETHDKIYPPLSNPAPPKTLVSLLLDHIPISLRGTVELVGPPVQLRQYIRFLQSAAKYTTAIRTAALSLSPEVRGAIAGLMEIPSPHTRDPDNAVESLRALQWRLLMVKRGLQGVVREHTVAYWEVEAAVEALRLAMRNISYAQECVEDLDLNGPKVEDARTLVEEMEKSTRGSYLLELRKEMETRLEANVAWNKVDEMVNSHGLSSAAVRITRKIYHRMRQYEENYPRVLDIFTKAQEDDNMTYARRWRRKPFTRSQRLLNDIRKHKETFRIVLDHLIALHPENDEKVALLREAKQALDISTDITDDYILVLKRKAKRASWLEWADIITSRLELVGELVERTMAADKHLEQYLWGGSSFGEVDMDKKNLYFDARMELVITYDIAWRMEKRMKQDAEDLREVSLLLCEGAPSEFEVPSNAPRELKRFKAKSLSWKSEDQVRRTSIDHNQPSPMRPNDASTAEAPSPVLILDE
ncbi:unnamed protein product [Rhizoctonia solani]|uniref:Mitochondrial zinc maintenance protein 1, mitochondrial n=1 Tax=Rhizoctonia solani TaxID=456999 RepID=A0A8H3A2K4_9AGAM|nr:unnamed protein product [Rhizoctonia solani]